MAGTNEVQVGRYNAILTKLLAMKEGAPAPTLGPELIAVITLESDRPEWEFLGGGSRWRVGGIQAAVAARFGFVALNNPTDSGVVCIIEKIYICNPNVGGLAYDLGPRAVAAVNNYGQRLDTRQGTTGLGTTLGTDAAAMAGPDLELTILGPDTLPVDTPQILMPGTAYQVKVASAAYAFAAGFDFRIRPIEPSETR